MSISHCTQITLWINTNPSVSSVVDGLIYSIVSFVCYFKFLYFNRIHPFLYTFCIIMIILWVFWIDNIAFVVMCLKSKKSSLFYLPCSVFRILAFVHLSASCKPYVTYVSHLGSLVFPVYSVTFREIKKPYLCSWNWTQLSYIWIFRVAFKDGCLTSQGK